MDVVDEIPETIAGLQIAARRLRGRTGSGGLGDFSDVVTLAGGRIGLVVGDVHADMPGHLHNASPPAFAGIALARSVLRATANIESRPSRVLASLNQAMLSWPTHERPWMGAVYATVRATRFGVRVRASAAGDQGALVRQSDGGVIPLGRPGSLLGLQADPNLADDRCMLRSGDSLVLVTETVAAALGPSGAERLRELVAELGAGSAARTVAAILGVVGEQCRGRIERDIAALALKLPGHRRGSGQHASEWPGTHPYLTGESPPNAGP